MLFFFFMVLSGETLALASPDLLGTVWEMKRDGVYTVDSKRNK